MRLTELQHYFNKKFAQLAPIKDWRHWLTVGVQQGVTLAQDLRNSIDHPKIHQLFGHLEGLLQPQLASLGIRLSKVTDHSVEVVLPDWWRTRNAEGTLDEGTLVTAGFLAVKTLLGQTVMFSHLPVKFDGIQLENNRALQGTLHARVQWTHLQQESVWVDLRQEGTQTVPFQVSFLTEDELKVAELTLEAHFILKEYLSHPSSSQEAP